MVSIACTGTDVLRMMNDEDCVEDKGDKHTCD